MSYILDALKKSEEERKKGDVPGLQTYTPTSEVSSGKKTWVIGVVVLIGTNIIGLFLWAPWQTDQPSPVVVQERAPQVQVADEPPVVAKPVVRQPIARPIARPVLKQPIVYRDEPASVPVIRPTPKEEYREKKAPSTAYLPQLSELPQSIQAQIPDLTFSSHMYSSQDRFRSITINGKRLKQGRYYNEFLYVNEITEKGAILGFEGTLFEVDVLGQWGN